MMKWHSEERVMSLLRGFVIACLIVFAMLLAGALTGYAEAMVCGPSPATLSILSAGMLLTVFLTQSQST